MENIDVRASVYRRVLEASWLAVIFLIPLFFNPLSHQAFYLNKALLLQFLVFVMLALSVADWINSSSGYHGLNWKRIINTPLHLAILAFGLMAIIATIASITPATSFWGSWGRGAGLLTLICWILFFLIVAHNLRRREQLVRAIYALLLASAIVSVLGILQYYFSEAMQHFFRTAISTRVASTTGNILSLSAFLAMVIPLNLALIVQSWNGRKEGRNTVILVALSALLVLQFWCLWLAQYSVTILLFIIAPIVFITLLGIIKRNRFILGLGIICLLTLIITAASLVMPMLVQDSSLVKPETEDSGSVFTPEELLGISLGSYRLEYWRSAIDIVTQSPEVPFSNDSLNPLRTLIGYGPETFIITFQSVFPEELRNIFTHFSHMVDRPHNHYLYLATTVGLLGLAGFITILAAFFYLSWRHLRNAPLEIDKLLLIAIMAGMVQYMADSLFNPSTLSAELVFWLMLALVLVMGRFISGDISVQDEVAEAPDKVRDIIPSSPRTRAYMSIVCVILLVASGVGLTFKPFLADIQLQKGLRLQAKQSPQAVWAFSKATEIQPEQAAYWGNLGGYAFIISLNSDNETVKTDLLIYSTENYEKARELEPYIAYRYYILADAYVYWAQQGADDKWPTALSLYDQALQLLPENAVILNKMSLALIIRGDYDEARQKLEYAASIDPDWAETSFLSGLLLSIEGRNDEAAPEIMTPIENRAANLRYFRDLCSNLIIYDMLYPLENALEARMQEKADEWIPRAMLGITGFYANGPLKSLDEFNTAMSLVPDRNTRVLFQIILEFADISQNFKTLLSNIAPEWRDKLSLSPDSDTLLPELDELINAPG